MSRTPTDDEQDLALHIMLSLQKSDLNRLHMRLNTEWLEEDPDLDFCDMIARQIIQYIDDNPPVPELLEHYTNLKIHAINVRTNILKQRNQR